MTLSSNLTQGRINHNGKEYELEYLMNPRTYARTVRVRTQEFMSQHHVPVSHTYDRLDPYTYIEQHERFLKEEPDYRHLGLTNRQLSDPEVRQAWMELKVILALKGLL